MFCSPTTLVALAPDARQPALAAGARRARRPARRSPSCSAPSLAALGAAIAIFSARFGDHAIAAAGVAAPATRQDRARGFRRASPTRALRRKEWTLLRRDPWLVSQTLMQLLYLLPPALLLWRNYGDSTGALVVLVPVLVMAAGQLAGGLAWLAISGEDAPDLVATAPVPTASRRARQGRGGDRRHRDRVRAVHRGARVRSRCLMRAGRRRSASWSAAAAATAIQLWFRAQATRRHFRRRQTSSRVATFAEAFSSIAWAATAALAAGGTWFALFPAAIGLGILLAARWMSPHKL